MKKKAEKGKKEPKVYCQGVEMRDISTLKENPRNPNTHPQHQLELLADIIKGNGWRQPIIVSDRSGLIVKGHGRYQAALLAGFSTVPVEVQHYDSEAAELADLLADNRIAELAEMDNVRLVGLYDAIAEQDADFLPLTGFSLPDIDDLRNEEGGEKEDESDGWSKGAEKEKLSDTFLFPPFSVLDARIENWQKRKRLWLNQGIKSGESRENKLSPGLARLGKIKNMDETKAGVSIFDPVLCELAVRWFSGDGCKVLDPFAGGSVRGIVSASLGREYIGIELREEQVLANRANASEVLQASKHAPLWIIGDSNVELESLPDDEFDMILSCPPYADLEVYSKDERDISNMPYTQFLEVYRSIIRKSFSKLKANTFAVWVVGEVRGKDGNFYNFLGDTIQAFIDAGYHYYNEAVLITSTATTALRSRRPMQCSRKLAKTHQNVLVFVKGSAIKAAAKYGEIALADTENGEMEECDND